MSAFGISKRLQGKNVLITGASSGIGAATAILFSSCGANVIITARRADKLNEVRKNCLEAQNKGGNGAGERFVLPISADMTKKEEIDGILDKLEGRRVDILVNNAGMVRGRDHVGGKSVSAGGGVYFANLLYPDIANDDIETMIQTNVVGLIRLTQIMVREMKKQNSGFIVNLGSIAGREAYVGGSIYCATKFAVSAFSTSLMKELVNTSIRVCEIQPGMVETEFSIVRFGGDKQRADNEYIGLSPLTGDDIAEEIVWCASRPEHVQVAQMLIFPTAQAAATISYRKPQ